jgi:hypothetical protein
MPKGTTCTPAFVPPLLTLPAGHHPGSTYSADVPEAEHLQAIPAGQPRGGAGIPDRLAQLACADDVEGGRPGRDYTTTGTGLLGS